MTATTTTTRVPFLDLLPAQQEVQPDLDAAWGAVTASASYIGGEHVRRFEQEWASYCGTAHALGVANGTDAIELVLRGLGVGPGDEVVVPANTFIATAEAVVAVGAVPHFVDVDPDTLLMTAETVAAGMTPRTAAVIVVHLFGQVADVPSILELTHRAGVPVVEDAAQAHGASWGPRRAGSHGVAGCFSFYPGKNLGGLGDGGTVTTDDVELLERMRSLADHGRAALSKHEHPVVGRNSRLDSLQAAALSVKLTHLDRWNGLRREAHAWYAERLAAVPGVTAVRQDPRGQGVHHVEVVRVAERERVREELLRAGIETGIHYPVPCHLHEPYAGFPRAALPAAESAAPQILSLPMFPHLSEAQVEAVVATLRDAV